MASPESSPSLSHSFATTGFENVLWLAAETLRSNKGAAEQKRIVLGLTFLKFISKIIAQFRARLVAGKGDRAWADADDPDEYEAENVSWGPADAGWTHLQASARQSTIGIIVDDAIVAIERDNPLLKGVHSEDYARPGPDKQRLGEVIYLICATELTAISEGEKPHLPVDMHGRVYECFRTRFASAEGKNGVHFCTPSHTARRLALMNLAQHCADDCFGSEHAHTFRRDPHPDIRADYVLANPPFNASDWFHKDYVARWQFGVLPKSNANFA